VINRGKDPITFVVSKNLKSIDMKYSLLFALFLINTNMLQAQTYHQNTDQPDELGTVDWIRNFDDGLAEAKKENKPVFLLFQEVPGCATCRNYGHNVLSHPLIAEAIETLFVPVAIYNNKGGSDAKVLKYYNEPTWNNPVVRIVGSDKKDIVKRIGGNYSKLAVVKAMEEALTARKLTIPTYLKLLSQELSAKKTGTETATFSMYCFWTGEKNIGKLDGVVETQPGFMGGREVVQIEYDPTQIDFETVLHKANRAGSADRVFAENAKQEKSSNIIVGNSSVSEKGDFRLDREPKYFLSKTVYQYIPMTQIQATKANSLVGQGQLPNEVLSPRQIELVEQIRSKKKVEWKSAINVDIQKAWEEVGELL